MSHVGSSPRVRGTGARRDQSAAVGRFIPACAGNGPMRFNPTPDQSVHPRVCGERTLYERKGMSAAGSSPRVRGTGVIIDGVHPRQRFIPACAGNGSRAVTRPTPPTVHPRVCGERRGCVRPMPWRAGSSPRVRGTGTEAGALACACRFIPACAGNGYYPRIASWRDAVHPRVCGERHRLRRMA